MRFIDVFRLSKEKQHEPLETSLDSFAGTSPSLVRSEGQGEGEGEGRGERGEG